MGRIETIGNATLYLGDCRQILPTIRPIEVVVTSPPYAQQREYGLRLADDWGSIVGSLPLMPHTDKTQMLINLGLVHRDGQVIEYWEPLKSAMRSAGWRFFGWYIWDQQFGLPGDWNGRLAPSHEFIFHFNKSPRSPNKIKSSVSVGRKIGKTALTQKDGTSSRATGAGDDVNPRKIPDSVLRITREMSRSGEWAEHPARFPENLPGELAAAFSSLDETICDPFMGSGTTGVACIKLGRRFIGIEIEPKYFDIACRRIEEAARQGDMFVEQPPAWEQATLSLPE